MVKNLKNQRAWKCERKCNTAEHVLQPRVLLNGSREILICQLVVLVKALKGALDHGTRGLDSTSLKCLEKNKREVSFPIFAKKKQDRWLKNKRIENREAKKKKMEVVPRWGRWHTPTVHSPAWVNQTSVGAAPQSTQWYPPPSGFLRSETHESWSLGGSYQGKYHQVADQTSLGVVVVVVLERLTEKEKKERKARNKTRRN